MPAMTLFMALCNFAIDQYTCMLHIISKLERIFEYRITIKYKGLYTIR
jgi:hypothetical protein